jgi:hypothetical protein
MKIDYMQNPLAIVKKFDILYDKGQRHLEGRIYARGEEGLDEANWFDGEVRYPDREGHRGCEIGGVREDQFYQDLKRGAPTQEEAEQKIRRWCESFGLEISAETEESVGVTR